MGSRWSHSRRHDRDAGATRNGHALPSDSSVVFQSRLGAEGIECRTNRRDFRALTGWTFRELALRPSKVTGLARGAALEAGRRVLRNFGRGLGLDTAQRQEIGHARRNSSVRLDRFGIEGRLAPPENTDYGLREMALTDPDGNLLRMGSELP